MIVLDYRDKRPIYEQMVEKLSQLIACGALPADSKMPSVRSLAIDLSVNPNTVQRAYSQLEQDGYIYTIGGRGNFVADQAYWRKGRLGAICAELETLMESAKHSGLEKESILVMVDRIWSVEGENGKAIAGGEEGNTDD